MPTDTTTTPPNPEMPQTAAQPQHPGKRAGKSSLPKLLMVIVILFVALVAVYGLTRNNKSTPSASKRVAQLQKASVNITDTGFVPATIQVKAGTQITWTNSDTAVHQVAADPYPADNSIPGFNSSVILQSKASMSAVISKPGTYTYHDEQHPLDLKGTIEVK